MDRVGNSRLANPFRCLLFAGVCLVIVPAACSKERDNPWDPYGINPGRRDGAATDQKVKPDQKAGLDWKVRPDRKAGPD